MKTDSGEDNKEKGEDTQNPLQGQHTESKVNIKIMKQKSSISKLSIKIQQNGSNLIKNGSSYMLE